MLSISGYKYATEPKAKDAVKACNNYYLPNVKDTTKNWIIYNKAEFNKPAFFYIKYHHSLNEVLGEPMQIEIKEII